MSAKHRTKIGQTTTQNAANGGLRYKNGMNYQNDLWYSKLVIQLPSMPKSDDKSVTDAQLNNRFETNALKPPPTIGWNIIL